MKNDTPIIFTQSQRDRAGFNLPNNEICEYDGGDCCPITCLEIVAAGCPDNTHWQTQGSDNGCCPWADPGENCGGCEDCQDSDDLDCQEGAECAPICGDDQCNCGETYEFCPEDCLAPGECEDCLNSDNPNCEEAVLDCSGDLDCCPESWIGDGLCDNEEQTWNCDLSCYDNDGGDCDEGSRNSSDYKNKKNKKLMLFEHQTKIDKETNIYNSRKPKRIN